MRVERRVASKDAQMETKKVATMVDETVESRASLKVAWTDEY